MLSASMAGTLNMIYLFLKSSSLCWFHLLAQGKSDAQRLDGWDTLYLEYKVEWPMGLLLTPPVIAK